MKYQRDGGRKKKRLGAGVLDDSGPNRPNRPKRGVTFGSPPAKRNHQFGPKQKVGPKVRQRAQKRAQALGGVPGVNFKDGLTGREARKIKRRWINKGRPTGPPNRPGQQRRPPGPRPTPVLDAMTELQYGGQEQELAAQRRIGDQRLANVDNWYANYQQQMQQAAQQNAAYTAGLQQAQFSQANQLAAQDQQANAALLQQQQADAAKRGQTVDPSVAQNMQAGVASRQVQASQFGGLLANTGQAQQGYLQGRVGTVAGEDVQARMDEQARARKVDQLARDLQAEKGAFRTKTAFDLRQQRHDNRLENAAYGLDVIKEQNDQENEKRDDRRDARQKRWDRRQDRAGNKLDRLKERNDTWKTKHEFQLDRLADLSDDGRRNFSKTYSSGDTEAGSKKNGNGKNGTPKYTPSQKNAKQEEARTARTLASQLKGKKPGAVITFLTNKKDIDPLVARAVVAPWTLTARQRNELRRMGIKVRAPGENHPGTLTPRNPGGAPG